MAILFTLSGMLFILFGGYMVWDARHFRQHAYEVPGKVVALEQRFSSSSNTSRQTYYPIVEYQLGQTFQFRAGMGSRPPSHVIGEEVVVMVNQQNPRLARLKGIGRTLFGKVFAGLGAMALAIGLSPLEMEFPLLLILFLALAWLTYNVPKWLIARQRSASRNQGVFSHNESWSADAADIDRNNWITDQHALGQSMRIPAWLVVLILFIGVSITLAGAYLLVERQSFLRQAYLATGTVTGFDTYNSRSDGKTKRMYQARVEFMTEDDHAYQFVDRVSSSSPLYDMGESVNVRYLPDDPQQAMISSGGLFDWAMPLAVTGLGVAFLFGAFHTYKLRLKQKNSGIS